MFYLVNQLKTEIETTHQLIKNIFKSIEKLNSHLSPNERIGYLKFEYKDHFFNLHQSYRTFMLKGNPPQFSQKLNKHQIYRRSNSTTVSYSVAEVESFRSYSRAELNELAIEEEFAQYYRPSSSLSKHSLEGTNSAIHLLQNIVHNRQPSSSSQVYKGYSPSIRASSPCSIQTNNRYSPPSTPVNSIPSPSIHHLINLTMANSPTHPPATLLNKTND
jgi:hypothetical protein